MRKKEPESLEFLIRRMLRGSALEEGLAKVHVYEALMQSCGCADYVLNKDFRGGVLFCTLSSSIVRQQLQERKAAIMEDMNRRLGEDMVKDIVFR